MVRLYTRHFMQETILGRTSRRELLGHQQTVVGHSQIALAGSMIEVKKGYPESQSMLEE